MLKCSWVGEVRNVSLLVAIVVNDEGYREVLGICEGTRPAGVVSSSTSKERGLRSIT